MLVQLLMIKILELITCNQMLSRVIDEATKGAGQLRMTKSPRGAPVIQDKMGMRSHHAGFELLQHLLVEQKDTRNLLLDDFISKVPAEASGKQPGDVDRDVGSRNSLVNNTLPLLHQFRWTSRDRMIIHELNSPAHLEKTGFMHPW